MARRITPTTARIYENISMMILLMRYWKDTKARELYFNLQKQNTLLEGGEKNGF